MNKLKTAAYFTLVGGVTSVFAIIFLFLALSDIAKGESDLVLEWYVAGTSLIILSVFIVSVFCTLFLLLRNPWFK